MVSTPLRERFPLCRMKKRGKVWNSSSFLLGTFARPRASDDKNNQRMSWFGCFIFSYRCSQTLLNSQKLLNSNTDLQLIRRQSKVLCIVQSNTVVCDASQERSQAVLAIGTETSLTVPLLSTRVTCFFAGAFRFNVRPEYEHATGLLHAFVQNKHHLIRSQR